MNKLIFATTNEGKMKEIRLLLADLDYDIVSLKDCDIHTAIEEKGTTFEENAVIKAKTIMELTHEIVLADDSGLEVDYLDKAPGVYSARYLGENTSYRIKNRHILELLEGVEMKKRTARFVSAIACAFPDGEILTVQETMEGYIGYEERGENGFGYDPIFMVSGFDLSSAELSAEQKNKISHRGKALNKIKCILKERGI